MELRSGKVKRGLSPSPQAKRSSPKRRKLDDASSQTNSSSSKKRKLDDASQTEILSSKKRKMGDSSQTEPSSLDKRKLCDISQTETSSPKNRKLGDVSVTANSSLKKIKHGDASLMEIMDGTQNASSSARKGQPFVPLPYMGLSAEIWIEICRLLVEKPFPIRTSKEYRDRPTKQYLRECQTIVALAHTSWFMYEAAMPIFWSKNTFAIYNRFDGSTIKFFQQIRPWNSKIITSIHITNWVNPAIPWAQVSGLEAIRHISVSYPGRYRYPGSHDSRGCMQVYSEASIDWAEFSEGLSLHYEDEEDDEDDKDDEDEGSYDVIPMHGPGSELCQGFLFVSKLSWGVVTACLKEHELVINVNRNGRIRKKAITEEEDEEDEDVDEEEDEDEDKEEDEDEDKDEDEEEDGDEDEDEDEDEDDD